MIQDLIIDETNFYDHFRPVESGSPKEGEILATFRSMAELQDGEIKRDIVRLLSTETLGPKMAIQLMQKLCHADERWATRLVTQICSDLHYGMKVEDVYTRRYEFMVEMKFYTKRENVPIDNKHWSTIELKNNKEIEQNMNIIINDEKIVEEEDKRVCQE
jgi:hypothetical protein